MTIELEQPEIDFLILADRAEAVNGKLYLMGGGFDRLSVIDFRQPIPFSVSIGVLVPWNDANTPQTLHLWIETEDGAKITEFQAVLNVGRPPLAITGQSFRAIFAIQNLWQIPQPGTYVVKANIGDSQKSTRFYAILQQ
jgi:hypothetical protein